MLRHRFAVAALIVIVAAPNARAQKLSSEQVEQSVRFINSLQASDGGFRASPRDESDLSATTASLRALKYLHPQARPRDRDAVEKYVKQLYDPAKGSYSLRPGTPPDVRSTATGVMAAAELKVPLSDDTAAINRYFAEHALSLPEIYIAAASLDAAGIKTPKAADWIAAYEAVRKGDGSFGDDAFQHAGAVITILRMGGTVKDRSAAASVLRRAQNSDGGFAAKSGDPSDLSITYRIMRCFFMLREKPDLDGVRKFIANCRNDDGGYGVKPGEPSSASGTYYAAIVTYWLDQLQGS